MASLIKDPGGRRRIQFVGKDGQRKAIRLGKMSQETGQAVKVKVERLVAASISGHAVDNETANWVSELGSVLADKLAAVGLIPQRETKLEKLGEFIDAYIKTRKDAKPGTLTIWRQGKENLLAFFGADKSLPEVTHGDADEYRITLTTRKAKNGTDRKLSPQQADKLLRFAKLIFRAAKRKELISESPFSDVEIKFADVEDASFVSHEDTQKLVDACSDWRWRIIVALSRFGGLRCPSEVLSLRRTDIDWKRERMTVLSPKTEHHPGKASRVIPIFAELRPYLLEACEQAPEGAVCVVSDEMRRRADGPDGWVNVNLRTTMQKIVKRAGLTPWKRLFHNLRASRQTELEERFPSHVVCKWMGNSQRVARKNYLKVTDEHFERGAESGARAAHFQSQQAGEGDRTKVNSLGGRGEKVAKTTKKASVMQASSLVRTTGARSRRSQYVGDEGLEPPTLSV